MSASRTARRRQRRQARGAAPAEAGAPITHAATVQQPTGRGTLGLPMVLTALAAVAVAGYLVFEHLTGAALECGPLGGCDAVQDSIYSGVAGIPVALPGLGVSAIAIVGALAWWRWRERRGLEAVFVVTLASVVVLGYFTAIEAFVIGAWCSWCLTYAGMTLATLVLATLAFRRPLLA